MNGRWRYLAWVAQVVLALVIGGGGLAKVFGDPVMVDLFADIGAGQWFRYAVGTLEVAGAVGLLVPRLAFAAAVGLAVLLVGAAVTNVAVLGVSPLAPLGYVVIAGLVAVLRRPRPATGAPVAG
ncbi:DoxX family protein [Dactylosporangium sp. AC04546]|uniref:DoxX family protein n=1 Tax=Dactylosporangium sp. AC04546 TaxID=2862460 RepID=UPI001EE06CA2|nr:DoxX family protein [Dactylosporangium sp. AC04546]WVK88318.1 DoxX family protein [Dactylosporangium sp. AC04546]